MVKELTKASVIQRLKTLTKYDLRNIIEKGSVEDGLEFLFQNDVTSIPFTYVDIFVHPTYTNALSDIMSANKKKGSAVSYIEEYPDCIHFGIDTIIPAKSGGVFVTWLRGETAVDQELESFFTKFITCEKSKFACNYIPNVGSVVWISFFSTIGKVR